LICFVAAIGLSAQEIDQCENIVDLTVDAINNQDATTIHPHLSEDFKIAGQTGSVAKLVLDQLISQLGDKVLTYDLFGKKREEQSLLLKYSMTYAGLGEKEAEFVFNSNGQLSELSLFKMEVKI